ncbi:hypothetical protein C6A87_016885 [Mycobacterium sp. ITM-2016-00317]|uniref:hypothetical protein n=1 Tax=Mycobacterium sp. ITM-2016-00317 TaxID=2099694 RepID=UPI000D49F853|nr:hypothetical protein [Mycobacterium sp. ITM-2016-00317]WNG85620.1 hypothetical protein C6A87_016885 [Mycobacterium sp. ITM-2016-00317]
MKAKKPTRKTAAAPGGSARPSRSAGRSARSGRETVKSKDTRRAARENRRVPVESPSRGSRPTRDPRPQRSAPRTTPVARPKDVPARPKSASQAKARAKARKAKAPKVVKTPLRQRILIRLASIDLNPRRLVARVPFVVLIIGALGLGLGVTLWLSTDAAERSYQLGAARQVNQALMQQKEALERDVLQAQAPPALAEAARNLGMIPSRNTAHLVQDPAGNWIVVGTPKPAEGVPPPPLNAPLPEPAPPAPPAPRVVEPREVPVRLPMAVTPPAVPGAMPPLGQPLPLPLPPVDPNGEVPHAVSGELPVPGPVQPLEIGPLIDPAAPLTLPGPEQAAPPVIVPEAPA